MKSLNSGVEEYLSLRRALGFQMDKNSRILRAFIIFMNNENKSQITIQLALKFAQLPKNVGPNNSSRRLSIVRLFAQYWKASDPKTEVPPIGLLPCRHYRSQPYIYKEGELERLIAAAEKLKSKRGLRKQTYSTLFGLLVVTGLRISEVIAINRDTIDLARGLITIRETKFRKSRLIPLHESTRKKLVEYAFFRDKIYPKSKIPSFFLSEEGTRLTVWCIRGTFVKLSRQIGIRTLLGRYGHGPRIHDIRHNFAVKTMIRWYQSGLNVEVHLPLLSTYLGHVHPSDTYWYLSSSPELLGLASLRLEKYLGELS